MIPDRLDIDRRHLAEEDAPDPAYRLPTTGYSLILFNACAHWVVINAGDGDGEPERWCPLCETLRPVCAELVEWTLRRDPDPSDAPWVAFTPGRAPVRHQKVVELAAFRRQQLGVHQRLPIPTGLPDTPVIRTGDGASTED